MAFAAAILWEVRTTGNDLNGGAFRAGASGTDRSQQDAAQVVINNSTITATTPAANSNTLTFTAGYTPSAADLGNVVQITGGTNVNTGFYEVTGQTSTTWTLAGFTALTTGTGAGSAIVGRMGGAIATPGLALGWAAAGNDIYLKSGTYTLTTTTSNVSGGRLAMNAGLGSDATRLIGYGAARGDNGAKPVIKAGAGQTSFTLITQASFTVVDNVEVDGSGNTGVNGIGMVSIQQTLTLRCRARNCVSNGIQSQGTNQIVAYCEAYLCGTGFALTNNTYAYACEAHACTSLGFNLQGAIAIGCLAYANTGASHGFGSTSSGIAPVCIGCTAYGNGGAGFYSNSNPNIGLFVNCLAVSNASYGFRNDSANTNLYLENCAGFNNPTGNVSNAGLSEGFLTLTGDPFVSAGAGNFAINNTAGAGASLREAGWPSAFPSGTTSIFTDIGAAQAHVAAGSTVAKGIPTIAGVRR